MNVVVLVFLVLFNDGHVKAMSAVAPGVDACYQAGASLHDRMMSLPDVAEVHYVCLPDTIKPAPKA